jgi:hypothetical protein
LVIAVLILPLWAWGGTARAHAARTRIAVLGVSAEQLRPEVREKLASAVSGGLAASGADVVDSAATAKGAAAKGISDCETPTCRIAIADATGARYLMRGSVQTMGRNYTVHLEMIDGTTGTVIGVREDRCEICTENEAYETASVTASALKAEVVKRPAAPGDGADGRKIAVTDVAYPAVKDSPAAPMVSAGGSTAPGDQPPPRMRGWAWAAIGAGAAAIAAGIILVRLDSQQIPCMGNPGALCRRSYSTQGGGIALISGGALGAVLGTTLLVGRF